ncbi:hypothetical protein LAZ67_21000150 [Cordylochernes scorpioides]|uniref:Reverse transcriptase domain-containing protein n=1 Tax=Cordylochernes scorpioides TaxID=51811 RepID=A0ABY6LL49_9ARAC|nr:hypothetical protein LAZ67_21000150 [Cordylochernes scorpioides]
MHKKEDSATLLHIVVVIGRCLLLGEYQVFGEVDLDLFLVGWGLGVQAEPGNTQPVSGQCYLGLWKNNLMSSRQHGFMKSRSTITGMDKIIETILKHKQKELTSLIAIDIAGAFDNAWWPAIIKRMDNDDVPSDLIRIIKSYLNNEREVKFTYESETFYKKLTKGCPQGGPLSPLLWNILLNDLLINFDSMNADIICYADDVTIICWNKTIEGLKTASEYTLNYVIQWCNRNKLTISTEKTNMLYLHNRQKIPIKVNNNIIMPVKQVKILGMKFSNHKWKNKVNFTPHVNDILCKAGRMKNLLCSLSGNMWGLDTEKRLTLFKTIIRPVLTYGSEIWFKYLNNRCKQKLNSMQYQIILWAVRAYKTTSSNCVHSLAKIPLLTDYIESRIIKFDLAQMSIEDLITYEPHAPSIVKSFLHAKMNEIFENTNEIFRSFFVLGIPRFFRPNFYNIQFITDHGNFGKFLATIGAVKEPGCFCGGEIQDARHLLLECPIFRDFRENRFGRIGQLDEFVDKKEKVHHYMSETKQQSMHCMEAGGSVPKKEKLIASAGLFWIPKESLLEVKIQEKRLGLRKKKNHLLLGQHTFSQKCVGNGKTAGFEESFAQLPSFPTPKEICFWKALCVSNEEVEKAVDEHFNSLPNSHFQTGILILEKHWTKCGEVKGDYVY